METDPIDFDEEECHLVQLVLHLPRISHQLPGDHIIQ